MKYLHVIPPSDAYALYDTLKNLYDRVDPDEHQFIVTSSQTGVVKYCPKLLAFEELQFVQEPTKRGKNRKRVWAFYKFLKQADHIIWYSFAHQNKAFMLPLFWDSKLRDKSVWIRWYSEVAAEKGGKKWKDRILARIYSSIKAKIKTMGFLSDIEKFKFDERNKNTEDIKTFHTPLCIEKGKVSLFDELMEKQKGEAVHVQATDGATKFHGPITVLDKLSFYADENIKIMVPVNYGFYYSKPTPALQKYIDQIRAHARKTFGNKAKVLNAACPDDSYQNYLRQIDIAVSLIDVPTRYANLIYLLYLGKKIFYPANSTTYQYLEAHGIDVYDTNEITGMSFEEFIEPARTENGVAWAKEQIDPNAVFQKWQTLFDSLSE